MSTLESMVVPGPLGWRSLPAQDRRRWPAIAIVVLAALFPIGLFANAWIVLPYYAIAPGSARQVDDLIAVPEDRAFPPRGDVLLTTVAIGKVTPLEAFNGWRDPEIDVKSEEELFGPVDADDFQQQNVQMMETSREAASIVALRHLGYDVPARGEGAFVQGVLEGSPAAGKLTTGDVIIGVDGRAVTLADDAVAAIRGHQPGDTVLLDVEAADGGRRTESIVTEADPETGGPRVGVQLATKGLRFDMPFDVRIDSANIGGPSAGLAFTLGVIDVLTEGELTGGRKVAVTGTIELDGRVGDVGGVVQKTAAVRRAGATLFLVPPGEFAQAQAHANGKVKVVQVSTLAEALAALQANGGELGALAQPPPPR